MLPSCERRPAFGVLPPWQGAAAGYRPPAPARHAKAFPRAICFRSQTRKARPSTTPSRALPRHAETRVKALLKGELSSFAIESKSLSDKPLRVVLELAADI